MDYLHSITEHLEKAIDMAKEAKDNGKKIPMIAIADDGDRHSLLFFGTKMDVARAFLDAIQSGGEAAAVLKDVIMVVAAMITIVGRPPKVSSDDKDDR